IIRLTQEEKSLGEKLPEEKKIFEDISRRTEELQREAAMLTKECSEKRREQAETERMAEARRNDYNILVGKISAHNRELDELREKLELLQEQTSEVQLVTLKQQYEQAIVQLENIAI